MAAARAVTNRSRVILALLPTLGVPGGPKAGREINKVYTA